jgi:hypothetical protein
MLLYGLLLVATAASAADLGGNKVVMGGDATLTDPVSGNAILMGGNIEVRADVGGNLVATGGQVRVERLVGRNLVAAGGTVTLEGAVLGNLNAMGGTVELGHGAKVQGDASFAADNVRVLAPIEGKAKIGGNNILIDTVINGNVDVAGNHIELGPNARLNGRLRYASPAELTRDPAAEVHGAIERTTRGAVSWDRGWWLGGSSIFHDWQGAPTDQDWPSEGWTFDGPPWRHGWRSWNDWTLLPYGNTPGLLSILAALLIAALAPMFAQRLGATVGAHWGSTVLVGFLTLIFAPALALILVITIIGIPIALAIFLAWVCLLFLGYAASGVAFGQVALQRLAPEHYSEATWRVLAAALGMALLIVANRAPFIGGLVSFVAMLTGMGALLMQMRRGGPAPRPAI